MRSGFIIISPEESVKYYQVKCEVIEYKVYSSSLRPRLQSLNKTWLVTWPPSLWWSACWSSWSPPSSEEVIIFITVVARSSIMRRFHQVLISQTCLHITTNPDDWARSPTHLLKHWYIIMRLALTSPPLPALVRDLTSIRRQFLNNFCWRYRLPFTRHGET